MFIFLVMSIGILIGFRWFPQKWYKMNAKLQAICTVCLVFTMGVSLGSHPDFLDQLATLGIESLFFAVFPIMFSVAVVYFLTKVFLEGKSRGNRDHH